MHTSPLTTLAAAVLLGVAGQALASLTRLPAIIFLLVLGVLAGPHGLAVVEVANLGAGLSVIVSAFVAIILFEGALTLRPDLMRQALVPVRRLITVGAGLTFVGAAVASHLLIALPWPLAFLFASLIVVTGPTVIAPILRRVRLVPRLHAVLKSESILIDPVGVFIAVVTFQYVVDLAAQDASWTGAILGLLTRVGTGVLVGGLAGLAAVAASRLALLHRSDNEHLVNLGALGLALAAFALADRVQSESGILAVIVAGLILASAPIPFRAELEKFKEHVTTLGVSVLFILLAANLNLPLLLGAGWREVALLAALVFVIRPASVFLSTLGTGLTWREKAYVSLIAPRGILAAAMASYFAAELRQHGLAGANRIEMLVFCTIGVTVCLQGGWAALLARLLGVRRVRPEGVLLVGVNEWSLALASQLREWGRHVLFVDNSPTHCETARERGFAVHQGDATEPQTYRALDLTPIGVLVAMTANDAVNTLACEATSAWLGEKNVLQVVSKPDGTTPRPRVRMAGRWAMPSKHSHQEITHLLAQKQLAIVTETCQGPRTLTVDPATRGGLLVPLLVLDGGRVHIATEGQTCPDNAILIGVVRPEEWHSPAAAVCQVPAA